MVKNPFKEALLEKKEFVFTLELVPGRGSKGKTQEDVLRLAERAAKGRLIQALSITDNAGGIRPFSRTPWVGKSVVWA